MNSTSRIGDCPRSHPLDRPTHDVNVLAYMVSMWPIGFHLEPGRQSVGCHGTYKEKHGTDSP